MTNRKKRQPTPSLLPTLFARMTEQDKAQLWGLDDPPQVVTGAMRQGVLLHAKPWSSRKASAFKQAFSIYRIPMQVLA